MPEVHYAKGRRCYNGALSTDLKKEIDSKASMLNKIKEQHPGFSITYFPAGAQWMSFINHLPLTGYFCGDEVECLLDAWDRLMK